MCYDGSPVTGIANSVHLPQMSMLTFEHYMRKRNVESAIQHYKIYKQFQSDI